MTFVPASDPGEFVVLVGGVAVMVGSLQWLSHREAVDPGRIVARCADGSVIGERGTGVRRRGLHGPAALRRAAREDLAPGDLAFVRVREGRADEPPWVVEGLGDEREPFGLHWEFATPDEALAAFRSIEERIARPPLDPAGHARHLSDDEFDALWSRSQLAAAAAGR